MLRLFALAFALNAWLGGVAWAAQDSMRIALVVGNANYAGTAKLRNPTNDAKAMSLALRELGFQVIEKLDVSQKELNRAIAQFGEKLNEGSTAIFYYAGHGMQVKGKNFLIPVDAEISSESAVRTETVDVDVLLDQFATRRSTLNVVILDACRNNPFERKFRSGTGGGLAQIEAPEGTMIAYATAPGKVASDGEGENGIYTQELLKSIRQPGRPVEQVFKDVRRNVMKATSGNQTPWESSSLTGDFYFKTASLQTQTIETRKPAIDPEEEAWKTVQDSNSIPALQAFTDAYPKGKYAGAAKVRMVKLQEDQRLPPAPKDSVNSSVMTDSQKKAEIERKLRDFVNAR